MKLKEKDITSSQMSSIHIAYRQWAELLNEAGYTINKAIDMGLLSVDIPFTEENVKQIFGYLAIKHLYPDKFEDGEKPKHPRLSTTQTQLLFDTLNANFAAKFGISIPFPAKDEPENNQPNGTLK